LFVVGVTGIQIVSPNPIQVIMQIGQGCLDAGLSPDGSTLYCLTPASNSGAPVNVVAYNTTTGALTNTFPTGFFAPSGSIAITPDGASLFVSLETPVNSPGAVLEKIDVASGAISDANTPLYGMLAIQ